MTDKPNICPWCSYEGHIEMHAVGSVTCIVKALEFGRAGAGDHELRVNRVEFKSHDEFYGAADAARRAEAAQRARRELDRQMAGSSVRY